MCRPPFFLVVARWTIKNIANIAATQRQRRQQRRRQQQQEEEEEDCELTDHKEKDCFACYPLL